MGQVRKSGAPRYIQYAALPYRRRSKSVEVMLVTSRGARRWIIPKGWPKPGIPPGATASEEAYEEAGVFGRISDTPIGSYSYEKLLKKRKKAVCDVQVYALEVTSQSRKWPESRQRKAQWFKVTKAPKVVQQTSLRRLIRSFEQSC